MVAKIEGYAKRILHKLGLEVHRAGSQPRMTLGEVLANAAKTGLTPTTIIDVGVADRTPRLYDTFTGAKIVLVEPSRNGKPRCRVCGVASGPTMCWPRPPIRQAR